MNIASNIERKELLKQYKKLLVFAYMTDNCRTNKKQMKYVLKLIRNECKLIRKSKSVLSVANLQKIEWNYMDLFKLSKGLNQKNVTLISKATADFDEFLKKLETETNALKVEVSVRENKTVQDISEKVAETIEAGKNKIGDAVAVGKDKIGDVVSSGMEKLKKALSRDAD